MIFAWKAELERFGFIYKKFSPSERAFVRENGVIEHQIWEDSFRRNKELKFVINTTVSVQDPFAGESKFVTIVSGRLDSTGVILPKSEGNVGRFWDVKDSNEALGILIDSGMEWFSKYIGLLALKEFVDSDLVTVPQKRTAFTNFFNILGQNDLNLINMVKIKPINRLKLCLIEYHMGNIEAACEHAKEWLKHTSKMPGEPARTLRQLREMGCRDLGQERQW